MINIITGVIGLLAVMIFLGYYVVALTFLPLTLIIIGVLGMAMGDFVLSLRNNNDNKTST